MKRLFKKAFKDLFSNRRRAAIAVVAIIAGMVAFGSLLFSHEMIVRQIQSTYPAINPSAAILNVDRVDEELLEITKNLPYITDFEPKAYHRMRAKTSKDEWNLLELYGAEDFSQLTMNVPFPIEGKTNPGPGEMLLERDAMGVSGKKLGDTLLVQLPDGSQTTLTITGIINDLSVHPASVHRTIYAYVSFETLGAMGLAPNRMEIMTQGEVTNRQLILDISNQYIGELEANGYNTGKLEVSQTPGQSMHLEEYKTLLFLFRTFSFIAFIFGCMIMANLLTAIIAKQVKQIGILKAIGAKGKSILLAYQFSIFMFISLAVAIAMPLSALLAKTLSVPFLRISNMTLENTSISPLLFLIFGAVGLLVPMIITFFPITKGISISVRDALNESGTSTGTKSMSIPLPGTLSRPVTMSLRNAVRRKGRFMLNLATLALSGICFVVVLVTMISVNTTINNNIKQVDFDYHMITKPVEEELLKNALAQVPEIQSYESWGHASGKVIAENGQITDSYSIIAPINGSTRIQPQMVDGRWLQPTDENVIVLGHGYVNDYPDTQIGDVITLEIGGQQNQFTVAGILRDFQLTTIYMNRSTYETVVPETAKQDIVKITAQSAEKGFQRSLFFEAVENTVQKSGVPVLHSETKEELASVVGGHYTITFLSFFVVIIMIAVISSFGLASTMNLQTLERTKEIGIMKAIGSSKKQIIKIITSESKFIAAVSWCISLLLGLPAVFIGLLYFSANILEAPIVLNPAALVIAYGAWLLMTLLIGYGASKGSAKRAAKMTVKDSLAVNY